MTKRRRTPRICKLTPRKKIKKKHPITVSKFSCTLRQYETCHDSFLNCEQIKEYLCKLRKNYPSKIKLEIIGESGDQRPIIMVTITDGLTTAGSSKMATLIEAGSNGCDLMAVATALFLIDFLTKNSSLVKIMDYLVIPCSNPDAYEQVVTNNHGRSAPLSLTNNFPVPLGHNDMKLIENNDFIKAIKQWKENYCYRAPETFALLNAITVHQLKIKLFVSLQEDGEKIVYPYGYCGDELLDTKELKNLARQGQAGFKRRCFEVGSIYDLCGLTYGTIVDFLKMSQESVKFLYIIHIKHRSEKPETGKIISYGEDLMKCLKFMAKNVYMFYNRPQQKC